MDNLPFNPGFRYSTLDAFVLLIGAAATIAFTWIDFWTAVAISFVVLHFFLFCNVLRMSRQLKLVWAAIFATLVILSTVDFITWPIAFGFSILTTLIVATLEMRHPSYHGVAWQTINPRLPEWWTSRRTRS